MPCCNDWVYTGYFEDSDKKIADGSKFGCFVLGRWSVKEDSSSLVADVELMYKKIVAMSLFCHPSLFMPLRTIKIIKLVVKSCRIPLFVW